MLKINFRHYFCHPIASSSDIDKILSQKYKADGINFHGRRRTYTGISEASLLADSRLRVAGPHFPILARFFELTLLLIGACCLSWALSSHTVAPWVRHGPSDKIDIFFSRLLANP